MPRSLALRLGTALLVTTLVGASLNACLGQRASPSAPTASSAPTHPPLVRVQVLAFNDFHGNLLPPQGSSGVVLVPANDALVATSKRDPLQGESSAQVRIPAGGAAYLATHLKRLRAETPNTVVVSAGDLTGASPLLSNLFRDHPTVEVMTTLGLDLNGVGNHEFDRGIDALRELSNGCSSCEGGPFRPAGYRYLAANVLQQAARATLFPPYELKTFGNVKVAFLGLTLAGTPNFSLQKNVEGLSFRKEVSTINALVPELRAKGVSAIVVLVHEGGFQGKGGTYDSCEGLHGDLLPIVDPSHARPGEPPLDPAVDVVVSAHTHQAYRCEIGGRLVTSALSYGRMLTKIELTIDPNTHRVVEKHARNLVVTRDVPPDPEVESLLARYEALSAPIGGRVVGHVTADIRSSESASCESALGDVIADAQLSSTSRTETGGAVVAFMNPGGIRSDLRYQASGTEGDGTVTYAEAFEVQPFGNELVTMTLFGRDILELLEAQFGGAKPRVLQVSRGFEYAYTFDPKRHEARITRESVRLHGKPIEPEQTYRVTVNSFLAGGRDGFEAFSRGTDRITGIVDVAALVDYLTAHVPLAPPAANRIRGNGCQ
jgi:5'-nucleotidase